MYAIIEDSGTQIKVAQDDEITVDIRDLGKKKTIKFDRVLMVSDPESDAEATIGTPYVEGAFVEAKVLDEFKDKKIDVIKFKRRKGYKRKQGHRQRLLRVKISKISG